MEEVWAAETAESAVWTVAEAGVLGPRSGPLGEETEWEMAVATEKAEAAEVVGATMHHSCLAWFVMSCYRSHQGL